MSPAFAVPAGDPGALENLAAKLAGTARDFGDLGRNTATVTAGVRERANWTGRASDGYSQFTGDLAGGMSRAEAPLSRIATTVRDYAGTLRAAQQSAAAANSAQAAAVNGGSAAGAAAAAQDARYSISSLEAAGNAASAVVREAAAELEHLFEPDGPVNRWIEKLHAPWDAAGADAILAHYIHLAAAPGEWQKELKGLTQEWDEDLQATMRGFLDHSISMEDLNGALASYAGRMDAAGAFTDQWMNQTRVLRGALPGMRGLGIGVGVLAIAGDAYTFAKPLDGGVMGNLDRGVAVANATAAGIDVGADALALAGVSVAIPGVGEAVIGGVAVATGAYLVGDWAYHNIKPFHNFCNDVGHTTVSVVKGIGHGISSAAKTVESWF